MRRAEIFRQLKQQSGPVDEQQLEDLFDSLETVTCEEIFSKWRGGGFDTGHWLLHALGDLKWFGKWLVSKLDAKPLVCFDEDSRLYSNRSLMGEGSLWMSEFRGKVSAMIVYDGQPMFGHFRKVDHDTLLGVVSGKTLSIGKEVVPENRHQYFYLERISEFPAEFLIQ